MLYCEARMAEIGLKEAHGGILMARHGAGGRAP
jgi:hypothetical protein